MKWLVILLCGLALGHVRADEREADRQALRALAARYEEAINQGSFAGLKDAAGPEISAVFMTNVEVRGLPEMQAYYDTIKQRLGPDGTYSVKLLPDTTEFYGDMAIAHGRSDETVVTGGERLEYQSRWTAVLRKTDGRWLGLRLHVSIDPIENPFVAIRVGAAKWIYAGIGFVVGALVLLVIGKALRRKRRPVPARS